jgi:hypothetical protein
LTQLTKKPHTTRGSLQLISPRFVPLSIFRMPRPLTHLNDPDSPVAAASQNIVRTLGCPGAREPGTPEILELPVKRSWSRGCRPPAVAGIPASPRIGPATASRLVLSNLSGEIALVTDFFDLVQLRLEPVDVLLLVLQQTLKELS